MSTSAAVPFGALAPESESGNEASAMDLANGDSKWRQLLYSRNDTKLNCRFQGCLTRLTGDEDARNRS